MTEGIKGEPEAPSSNNENKTTEPTQEKDARKTHIPNDSLYHRAGAGTAVKLAIQETSNWSLLIGGLGVLLTLWGWLDRVGSMNEMLKFFGIPVWLIGAVIVTGVIVVIVLRSLGYVGHFLGAGGLFDELSQNLEGFSKARDVAYGLTTKKGKEGTAASIDIYLTAPIDDLKFGEIKKYNKYFPGIAEKLSRIPLYDETEKTPKNFVFPRPALLNQNTVGESKAIDPVEAYETAASALEVAKHVIVVWTGSFSSSVLFELGAAGALNRPTAIFYQRAEDFPVLLQGRLEKHGRDGFDEEFPWPVAFHKVRDLKYIEEEVVKLANEKKLFPKHS